jgi:hypothetical protein
MIHRLLTSDRMIAWPHPGHLDRWIEESFGSVSICVARWRPEIKQFTWFGASAMIVPSSRIAGIFAG